MGGHVKQITVYSGEESAVKNTITIVSQNFGHMTFVSNIHLRHRFCQNVARRAKFKLSALEKCFQHMRGGIEAFMILWMGDATRPRQEGREGVHVLYAKWARWPVTRRQQVGGGL